ncbi:MAG TPA: phage holin family protein [Pirellulales bacterium]|nr:phage holin family protein [Pirellulales bacterium]
MANDQKPLFAGVKAEAARLKSDIVSLARLRWQLARLEAAAAARSLRRLTVVLTAAALAAIVAVPILLVALAEALDGCLGVPRWAWLLALGLGLLLTAALAAWTRWRRFSQEFVGFEQTIEELREDVVWLRERFAKREEL